MDFYQVVVQTHIPILLNSDVFVGPPLTGVHLPVVEYIKTDY